MKKTFEVVMLSTDKLNALIEMRSNIGSMHPKYPKGFISYLSPENVKIVDPYKYWIMQHLYILSDDEIKEGDWYMTEIPHAIFQYYATKGLASGKGWCKKIVATTDKSLIEESRLMRECFPLKLHLIPESFIQAYIKAYNEGKPITEVDLEIEQKCHFDFTSRCTQGSCNCEIIIKSKSDNTVIIHQSKTYSEEDMKEAFYAGVRHESNPKVFPMFLKWIQNL